MSSEFKVQSSGIEATGNRQQATGILSRFLRSFTYCLLPVACCLLLTSCAAQKVTKQAENGYRSVLKKWTRDGKVYENFETKLLINATFKSEEFREAYVNVYSKSYMLDTEKLSKLMTEEREASKKYHEFFLSVHTPFREWSELEKKEPLWALYLVNDLGETVSPMEIKKLKEKGPGVTRFYPFLDDWSEGYSVKFPLAVTDGKELMAPETGYIKLIMTGPSGKTELVWKLKAINGKEG